jgi:hypothetical protein
MKSYSFQAELEIIGINPFVAVPPDILQKIFQDSGREKSPIPICGQINEKNLSAKSNVFQRVLALICQYDDAEKFA